MKTQREPAGRLCTLTLLGIVAFSPGVVLAHGGPPAALGLLAANPEGPEVILLNEGLAIKRPQVWSFLCPSIWGEPNQASGKYPLARSADGVDIWVCGGDDLYLLRDQQLVAQLRPEYRRDQMFGLANDAQHVYGLHLTGSSRRASSEVVRLQTEGDTTFWKSDDYWSAITADAKGIYVARVAAEKQLEVVTLDQQGQERSRALATLPLTPLEIQLHTLGERVYVTANDGTLYMFGYFDGGTWKEVLQDKLAILGPQASSDGTLWIAIGGMLARLHDDMAEPTGETGFITCLEQWNDWHYACVGSDLFQLTETGIGERVFELDGFHAPDPTLVPPAVEASCEQQWVLYSVDATRSGLTFVDWPDAGQGGVMSMADAGASALPSSSGAGAAAAAGAANPVAGTAVVAAGAPAPGSDSGCSVAAATSQAAPGWFGLLCAGIAAFLCVRRVRNQTRARR
jgi:hypothetical protein